MHMKSIHHASIIVSDTRLALKFYCDVLGMSLNNQRPALPFAGAWLDVGAQQIHLIEPSSAAGELAISSGADDDKSVSRDAHIAIMLDSLAGQALAELKDRLTLANIPFSVSQRRAALFCRDPDGNGLEFIEENTA